MTEVIVIAGEPEAYAHRYATLTGTAGHEVNGHWQIDLPLVCSLLFMSPETIATYLPGSLFSPPPSIAAMGFEVEDLDHLAELLAKGRFTAVRAGDRLIVPAEEALGVAHYFFKRSA